MNIKIAKDYEIKYWKAHKGEPYNRCRVMLDLFGDVTKSSRGIVADVGCGPRCGVFHLYRSEIMYGVDPLWKSYNKEGLSSIPIGVETITGYAESFRLPQLANVIFSINALDHSGSLSESIDNIEDNLLPGGLFCMHIHMRTKKQLNKGHKMLVNEQQIDDMLGSFEVVDKRIYDKCPIEGKPYQSYVTTVKKK